MNRFIRLLTILMLIMALPLNGMAGIDSATEPCPMQTMGMEMMAGMDHDCCQDQDLGKAGDHAKSCKVGQECRTASTVQLSFLTPGLTFAKPRPADTYAVGIATGSPPDPWRPPRV
ncbi:hypothetical protein [Pseudomonas sp. A2]|uniref:hypothetical protein n=1 Tax=unclassified Pseudomonas TaxID=196821 RepID=UPI002B9348E8|nr:hypothetical protein [Pseudomonas sp. A2]MEB3438205.1 hypothetical protein [Pseudomonas sp. A2]